MSTAHCHLPGDCCHTLVSLIQATTKNAKISIADAVGIHLAIFPWPNACCTFHDSDLGAMALASPNPTVHLMRRVGSFQRTKLTCQELDSKNKHSCTFFKPPLSIKASTDGFFTSCSQMTS